MKLVSFKTLGMYPVSSLLKTVGAAAVVALAVTAQASDIAAQSTPPAEATTPQFTWDPNDPRIGLRSG